MAQDEKNYSWSQVSSDGGIIMGQWVKGQPLILVVEKLLVSETETQICK